MESYEILETPKNLQSLIGQSVGIEFDCGQVIHPKLGDAQLKGISLCFQKYKETTPSLDVERLKAIEVALIDGLAKSGCKSVQNNSLFVKIFDAVKRYVTTYILPDSDRSEVKLRFISLILLVTELIQHGIETTLKSKGNAQEVVELYIAALQGDVRHLNRIMHLPVNLEPGMASAMYLRREAVRSKETSNYVYFQQQCIRWMQAMCRDDENYCCDDNGDYLLSNKAFKSKALVLLEAYWMYFGPNIPEVVRFDSGYDNYMTQLGIYIGIWNDLREFSKNLEKIGKHNLVMKYARSMTFQEAIDTTVKFLEETFYRVKDASRALRKSFPHCPIVLEILTFSGQWTDDLLLLQAKEISISSSLTLVKFNSVFEEKEMALGSFIELAPKPVKVGHLKNGTETERQGQDEVKQLTARVSVMSVESDTESESSDEDEGILIEAQTPPPSNAVSNPEKVDTKFVNHLAIIPDGNRRWARSQGLSSLMGHSAGSDSLFELIRIAFDSGIHTVTIWMLSVDNFKRTEIELDNLYSIFMKKFGGFRKLADKYGAKLCHIGRANRIPVDLQDLMKDQIDETKDRTKHQLNLAIDYGGREEIVQAVQKLIGSKSSESITPETISNFMPLAKFPYPDPDLIIRTGCKDAGTYRNSGFMIWQSVYSEFYFENVYMPEVRAEHVEKWLETYGHTEKRFGK